MRNPACTLPHEDVVSAVVTPQNVSMNQPRISVALATYNGERFLREQLESLANQTLLPSDLQVGDDGSSDGTLQILEEFRESAPFPVVVHRNDTNLGYGENFIQTALRCQGEWIAFCDQDDVWNCDKLKRCAAAIAEVGPELMLIVHDADVKGDEHGLAHIADNVGPDPLQSRLALPPDWSCHGIRQVFRKSIIQDIPASPRNQSWRAGYEDAHDQWIPFLANALGSTLFLREALVTYRRHETNTTGIWRKPELGVVGRARTILQNNGQAYAYQADVTQRIAELFTDLAARTRKSAAADHLRDAAAAARSYSDDLYTRAAIYRSSKVSQRLKSILRLLRSGRYVHPPWKFGQRALLKDTASALFPFALR